MWNHLELQSFTLWLTNPYVSRPSCVLTDDICIEHFEVEDWCFNVGGEESYAFCFPNPTNTCSGVSDGDLVVGGATIFYYNGFDGAEDCESAGGTYN